MADEQEAALRGIRANAEMVIQQFAELTGGPFGYDADSVKWTDGFIERQRTRQHLTPESTNQLIGVLGSYLGECILRSYGGHWVATEGAWAIEFDANNRAFPFNKVAKQFANGAEDSIYRFFTVFPAVFKHAGLLASPPEPHAAPTPPLAEPTPSEPANPKEQTRDLLNSLRRWFS